jgi:2,3-bisphosphoglycerate-dependent phosphoglycerate mutase
MPIYLVRHGETALNAARILQPADTPLSEEGLRQAGALAQRLKTIPIAAVLTSDLRRAMQTSQAIVAIRPPAEEVPLRLHSSALLHERNLGDLRGQPYDAIGVDLLDFKAAPPGGESLAQFDERVAAAFEYIVNLHQDLVDDAQEQAGPSGKAPDPTLIVVSHGLVIRRIVEAHLGLLAGQTAPERIANTSVTIFESAPPHLLELLNCSTHLLEAQSKHQQPAFGG